MAHGTKVDGTEYSISAGECLVDGTSYKIQKGQTLINGTSYSILLSKKTFLTVKGGVENKYYVCLNEVDGEQILDDVVEIPKGVESYFQVYMKRTALVRPSLYLNGNDFDINSSSTIDTVFEGIEGVNVNVTFVKESSSSYVGYIEIT